MTAKFRSRKASSPRTVHGRFPPGRCGTGHFLCCPLRVQEKTSITVARGEHAANLLLYRYAEHGTPPIVIASALSELNDNLIAFGQETLAARIAPLIASTKPAATGEKKGGSGRIITPS